MNQRNVAQPMLRMPSVLAPLNRAPSISAPLMSEPRMSALKNNAFLAYAARMTVCHIRLKKNNAARR